MLNYLKLFFIFEFYKIELIKKYYNNNLARHFCIKKTWDFITKKYYRLFFCNNIKSHFKKYNVYFF